MIKAVLFDLDGTLLHMDQDEFLNAYFNKLSAAVAQVVEPKTFIKTLLFATDRMIKDVNPDKTNQTVFWENFLNSVPVDKSVIDPLIDHFYNVEFNEIGSIAKSPAAARQAVISVIDLGIDTVIATNPVFPATAIKARLNWANLVDLPFKLITSFEHFHFCKPHAEYYKEIADRLGLQPCECLMVGNDIDQDMINSAKIGMKTYLVQDQLIPSTQSYAADYTGSLDQLPIFLNNLNK